MSKYTKIIPSDIQAALGWMLDNIEPNKNLLDVGCSSGYFGSYLKKIKDLKVDGIEISEDRHDAKKVLDTVYSFDLESPWPSSIQKNRYDYILLGDILEHLVHPELVLQKLKTILKQDGLIFISIPNIAHISTRLELLEGNFTYEQTGLLDNTHLRFFTLDSIKRMTHEQGYTINKIDYSFNDFPEKIINKILSNLGLKPTTKFWKHANSIEARAFQYKLILSRQRTKSRPIIAELPQKPEQLRDSFIADLQDQIKNIDKHAKDQAVIIENLRKEVTELRKPHGWLKDQARRLKKRLK